MLNSGSPGPWFEQIAGKKWQAFLKSKQFWSILGHVHRYSIRNLVDPEHWNTIDFDVCAAYPHEHGSISASTCLNGRFYDFYESQKVCKAFSDPKCSVTSHRLTWQAAVAMSCDGPQLWESNSRDTVSTSMLDGRILSSLYFSLIL